MTLKIFGVGTDIVKNSRIKKLIKNKKFLDSYLGKIYNN